MELNPILNEFKVLVEIVARLRGPNGCPWDQEQTQKSLTQYAIEEAFELVEAIEAGLPQEIREELGDFLFQVILQSQVAQDEGQFSLLEVLQTLNEKLMRRHPHVFGQESAQNSHEVWKKWDQLKALEKKNPRIFSYPKGLPALQAAYKIGLKTKRLHFDWDQASDVMAKVHEEISELQAEMAQDKVAPEALEHELGDVLFSVAQLARHLGLKPEQCLRSANRRFEDRFNLVLELSGRSPEDFSKITTPEKEALWQEAKKRLAVDKS